MTLKEARKQSGHSLEAVSNMTGISESKLRKWENGGSNDCNIKEFRDLCNIYNISIDDVNVEGDTITDIAKKISSLSCLLACLSEVRDDNPVVIEGLPQALKVARDYSESIFEDISALEEEF